MPRAPSAAVRNYALVTGAYWGFTLTDGALRMLVLLHFHRLGYSPVQLAFLFLLYEFFGIVTNLLGGWLAARSGLRITLLGGLLLQIVALVLLSALDAGWPQALSVAWVMAAQALSGIAKDLTKMSAKSALKGLLPSDARGRLFKWVALLTGSKNALKGVGFFLGGFLLHVAGYRGALWIMAGALLIVLLGSVLSLSREMGRAKTKIGFSRLFAKSRAINVLSLARFFLFGARDIWFVVGVPIFLYQTLAWSFSQVGAFMACWVIGYGIVQSAAPGLLRGLLRDRPPGGRAATVAALALGIATALLPPLLGVDIPPGWVLVIGLGVFGVVFAINSAIHSFLVLDYTDGDKVALDVGFYYMANAGGRLVGCLLSGLLFQHFGLVGCLWGAGAFAFAAAGVSLGLPRTHSRTIPPLHEVG
jgi:predicted MFS family arabinose efflux permease